MCEFPTTHATPFECGEFFRRALRVASCHHDPRRWILLVNRVNRLPRLQVRRRRHRAGVHHHDVRGIRVRRGQVAAIEQLPFDRRRVGLRRPASELFDEEGRHI